MRAHWETIDQNAKGINRIHEKDSQRLQAQLSGSHQSKLVIPSSFVAFVAGLGVQLTAGQLAFARAAYDGEPITDDGIFGGRFEVSDQCRRVVVAVCGARAGKSYVLIALRLLHGLLTRGLSTVAPGEKAVSLVVAPDLRLAKQVIGYARGALHSWPELAELIEGDSEYALTVRRPIDGRLVSLEALPATRGGGAVRGRSLIDAALDESAFFRDEGYAVNDIELYKAVSPRVLPGGQVIIASTPWAESGLLYDLFKSNYGHPVTALAAHAPTLVMHDSAFTRDIVEAERLRDPDNARREFDAQFMTSGTGQFFDSNAIKSATQGYDVEVCQRNSRYRYAVGVDLGFKSDSSACVVVEFDGEAYRIVASHELRPSPEAPLLPSEVVACFAGIAKTFGVAHIISDGHYREAIAEHLQTHQLGLIDSPAGHIGKVESYARARAVLHEGRCVLPDHPRLLSQLRSVVSRPTSGGGLSISSPRKVGGGHGDLVSAWVLAVHHLACARVEPVKELPPAYGTPAYEAWLAIRSEKAMMESDMKRFARKGSNDW